MTQVKGSIRISDDLSFKFVVGSASLLLPMNYQKWVVANEILSLPFSRGIGGEKSSSKHFGEKNPNATWFGLSELFSFQHHPHGTFVYTAHLREVWGQVESPGDMACLTSYAQPFASRPQRQPSFPREAKVPQVPSLSVDLRCSHEC